MDGDARHADSQPPGFRVVWHEACVVYGLMLPILLQRLQTRASDPK